MKRLKLNTGGQPIRPDDFSMIQEEALKGFIEIVKGLCAPASSIIVSGLSTTNIGGGNYTIAEGYFWDGVEICKVESFSYSYNGLYSLYLVKSEVESDNRKFFDGDYHNVVIERKYVLQYSTSVPANSFAFAAINRLSNILSISPNLLSFERNYSGYLALNSGYVAIDGTQGLYVLYNSYKDYQLIAAFTASVANGVLCTIPNAHRPRIDLFFPFRAGASWGMMIIKAISGEVQLKGAATAEGTYNYIQVETNLNANYPPIVITHL